jgi:type IV secretory pathway TrbF-like protein
MARKPLSYGILNIGGEQQQALPSPDAPSTAQPSSSEFSPSATPAEIRSNHPEAHLVKQRAQQVMVYMRPEAHKALNRYALEQSTFRNKIKPHDLLVEAVQDWFDRHGLREQVRVEPEKGRGT